MSPVACPIELWGGIECTVNRIRDRYFDQTRRTGHQDRPQDLERLASLGIRALRYPAIWERVAPDGLQSADWSWTDDRLRRLQTLGVRPILTLLHHGSGPRSTQLLDPDFPAAFAAYAEAVARRYPWVEEYTPINEPGTTARFSALYGHWYPHRRDSQAFVQALCNEIIGTVAAMRAIRKVNPSARLIQTEDAGRVYSAPALGYQAGFENQRRWLTFDLLAGRVDRHHPLHDWLIREGIDVAHLDRLRAEPCPADVTGLNYYLTSDRYLDERIHRFPDSVRGGNGKQRYADVEAVRVLPNGITGHQRVLMDAWHRYASPVALTEVHAGCTREDQVRWLVEAWRGAEAARDSGADVSAVTVWALLGSVDWNSLLTRDQGTYEPGAFDVRSSPPRPTAIARAVQAIALGTPLPAAALGKGWWRRPGRLIPAVPAGIGTRVADDLPAEPIRPVLIAGARGTLGSALVRSCTARGIAHVALGREDLDVTCPDAVEEMIVRLRPWAVINAAGYTRVGEAEHAPDACLDVNVRGAVCVAAACRRGDVRLVSFSSALVFDGTAATPYLESDTPAPVNRYGVSKWAAETGVLAQCPDALVIRSGTFFGPWDERGFLTDMLWRLLRGRQVRVANDAVISPTYVPDLAEVTLDLLLDGEAGLWHLANQGHTTWYTFAHDAAVRAMLDPSLLIGVPATEMGWRAARPRFAALASSRGTLLPGLHSALDRYIAEANWVGGTADVRGRRIATA